MKTNRPLTVACLVLAAALLPARAAIDLGTAAGFAVLAGTTVTTTGNTLLNGNLGVYPGLATTGFGPGNVNGQTYNGGAVAQQAVSDALAAYSALAAASSAQNLSGQNLGGLTLTPGVYQFNSSAQLTGQLTLNAQNNPGAQFIFQISESLTAADLASVVLENGAQSAHVYWQVGTSATLGVDSTLAGAILADQSITLYTGADLTGNALALNGAVTLDDNNITISEIPEPDTLWPVILSLLLIGGCHWMSAPPVFAKQLWK
jgi:type VI secretion system secreted protein VgrG